MIRRVSDAVTLARIANDHARLSLSSTGEAAVFYRKASREYRRASKHAAMRDTSRATVISSAPVCGCKYEGDF